MKTSRDLLDYLIDFLGDNASGSALRQAKLAVLDALSELGNISAWSYYYRQGRVATVAPYSTGTIDYDHTGGTYERQVTLASGTWPTWATHGVLYISNIAYEIEERKSNTVLTLTSASNPGSDVAAGTSYNLYRDLYPLPADFKSLYAVTVATNLMSLAYCHPNRWHDLTRNFRSSGVPTTFTIFGDANYLGQMSVGFFPFPDTVRQVDFIYQRRPRSVQVWDYHDGSITVTAGAATVAGSGTTFTSRMVGSILRVSDSTAKFPTGLDGSYPYDQERTILDVTSTTALRVDAVWDTTRTSVKYEVSDPLDIDEQQLFTTLRKCAERNLAVIRRMKEAPILEQAYQESLAIARAADSRYAQRWGMDADRYRVRWANHPLSSDSS